jgi:hypothetical protein
MYKLSMNRESINVADERVKFNDLMEEVWPKYLIVGLKLMQKALKLKDQRKLDIEIPEGLMTNTEEFADFINYVKSDMAIESTRKIKRNIIFETDMKEEELNLMDNWVEGNIIQDDEERIYNDIVKNLDPTKKWSTEED